MSARFARYLPFLRWWPLVSRDSVRADAIAGLAGAILVLPQGVAFATLAGMPPQYGLYAAMVPAIVAALFGSSWHLVSGPTNVISIFLFASLSPLAEPASPEYVQIALTVTFLCGMMQFALGLARMGALVNFISHTVMISFTAGAACLIFSAQLPNFFGVSIPRGASFIEAWQYFFLNLSSINPYIMAVGSVTLAVGIVNRKYYPRVPYMFTAMVAGTLFAIAVNAIYGNAVTGIAMLGALPGSVPELTHPNLSAESLRKSLPTAFAIAILCLTQAVPLARVIAAKSGQRIDSNQEFIGQGLSNLVGAFFSAYASCGSFNRSGANFEAGGRTPLAAIFSAILLVLILLVVAPLAAYLPLAVMAALLFMVAYSLFDLPSMRAIARTSRQETVVMLVTFSAAIFADLEFSIYAGVLLSLMLYLTRTARPPLIDVKPDPEPDSYHFSADTGLPDCPQLKMLRVNGSIFFGAADHVQGRLEHIDALHPTQRHVLVVASGINFIDIAGAEMLAHEARRRGRSGGGLYFYGLKDAPRKFLEHGGYLAAIGRENVFSVKTRAVGEIYRRLDPEICRHCKVRIFRECRERLPNGEPVPADAPAGDVPR